MLKYINDYYEEMYQKFPGVPQQDIRRILNYGFKSLYLHNSYGGDVVIRDNSFWSFIGNLTTDSLKHFEYYIRKLSVKLRVLYKRKKIPWDGYYYFALTQSQYEAYEAQKNKRGRPKKNFTFTNIVLYKLLDECKIKEHAHKYIFRVQYPINSRFVIFKEQLVTDKSELIIVREPLKFSDILVSNNQYDVLNGANS